MSPVEKIKVLLVDDHPFLREGVRCYLEANGGFTIVGEAEHGGEALIKVPALCPDVVVMDITMPVMGGIEACRQLRKICPSTKVLILTMWNTREFTIPIIEAGAHGFLAKDAPATDLARAIVAVHNGERLLPGLAERFVKEYVNNRGALKPAPSRTLTARQLQVVTLLAEGFSNKEAADMLGVGTRTVEKHRERIMAKLELRNAVDLTRYAVANKLIDLK